MSVRFGATDRERTILFDARLPSRSPHDADTAPYVERLAARLALQPVEERIVANENIRSNAFTAASTFAHICDRCHLRLHFIAREYRFVACGADIDTMHSRCRPARAHQPRS
ncbi:hypothetical protein [Burkholderia dolosa]|uniref:hypothetical protein n=1 Tax=Burkholderia dolosa TaxID=152500 RepID=UPI001B8EEF2E|nr:hypothetical protein [Burkholderia dolosa]MBR8060996.1 hypothetical protein [Burkholderia dolosa]